MSLNEYGEKLCHLLYMEINYVIYIIFCWATSYCSPLQNSFKCKNNLLYYFLFSLSFCDRLVFVVILVIVNYLFPIKSEAKKLVGRRAIIHHMHLHTYTFNNSNTNDTITIKLEIVLAICLK